MSKTVKKDTLEYLGWFPGRLLTSGPTEGERFKGLPQRAWKTDGVATVGCVSLAEKCEPRDIGQIMMCFNEHPRKNSRLPMNLHQFDQFLALIVYLFEELPHCPYSLTKGTQLRF